LQGIPRNWNAHKLDFTAYLRDRHITGSEYIPRVSTVCVWSN